jgi:PAS domain S-box-containing protein
LDKAQILIVEDESVVALDIQSRLMRLDYAVPAIASSGEEAIHRAEKLRPDLALMDIKLKGDMDGVEAAEEIRTRLDIPVVFLTAYADAATLQRAKITESYGYLLKPFKEGELHTTIEMALYKHKMERRLKESERWLSTTLKSIGDAVIATDAQGCVKFMNPVAEALTGWTEKQALGQDFSQVFNIIDGETHTPSESPFTQVLREAKVIKLKDNTLLIAKDGTEIPIDDSAAPIQDDTGSISGVALVFRDITEQVRAQEALRRAEVEARRQLQEQTILREAMVLISSTLDQSTVLHHIAERMGQAVDATSAYICGSGPELRSSTVLAEYIGPHACTQEQESDLGTSYPQEDPRFLEALSTGQPWIDHVDDPDLPEKERSHLEQYGAQSVLYIPLHVRAQIIGFAELWESRGRREFTSAEVALCQAIAQNAAIAIENARLYEQLQQELTERMQAEQALSEHAAELQARNEELDAFAHTVAHDLKNPVNLTVGFAEVLARGHADMTNEELQHYLQIIVHNGRRMGNIIDELLLLASVRRNEVDMKPLDMASIVTEAQERLSQLIEDYQAEITLPTEWPIALGHGPWIQEVWANYLSNGIKYGGQPPKLDLGAKLLPDGKACFWIRDNGSGLTPEDQAKLFRPFTQLDRVRANGHGLGLSIVQRIVEKLNGKVGVASQVGRGSIFSFTLPGVPGEGAMVKRQQS